VQWKWNATDIVKSCLVANFDLTTFDPITDLPTISQKSPTIFLEAGSYDFFVWGVYNNDQSISFNSVRFIFTVN
jgi:hypothetical protein